MTGEALEHLDGHGVGQHPEGVGGEALLGREAADWAVAGRPVLRLAGAGGGTGLGGGGAAQRATSGGTKAGAFSGTGGGSTRWSWRGQSGIMGLGVMTQSLSVVAISITSFSGGVTSR